VNSAPQSVRLNNQRCSDLLWFAQIFHIIAEHKQLARHEIDLKRAHSRVKRDGIFFLLFSFLVVVARCRNWTLVTQLNRRAHIQRVLEIPLFLLDVGRKILVRESVS
jgi:hypothetical protein